MGQREAGQTGRASLAKPVAAHPAAPRMALTGMQSRRSLPQTSTTAHLQRDVAALQQRSGAHSQHKGAEEGLHEGGRHILQARGGEGEKGFKGENQDNPVSNRKSKAAWSRRLCCRVLSAKVDTLAVAGGRAPETAPGEGPAGEVAAAAAPPARGRLTSSAEEARTSTLACSCCCCCCCCWLAAATSERRLRHAAPAGLQLYSARPPTPLLLPPPTALLLLLPRRHAAWAFIDARACMAMLQGVRCGVQGRRRVTRGGHERDVGREGLGASFLCVWECGVG